MPYVIKKGQYVEIDSAGREIKVEETSNEKQRKLFPCEGCLKEISVLATSCPNCGHPVRKDESGQVIGASKEEVILEHLEEKSNGFGIACFVLSLLTWIPILGVILGILSFVFGIVSLNTEKKRGFAIAGLLILLIPVLIFFVLLV